MPRNLWDKKELQTLQICYPETTPKEIMQLLPNRSYDAINIKASRLGIKKKPDALSRTKAIAMSGSGNPAKRPEVALKISQANKGRKYSPEVNKTKGRPGILNHFYGKHHSPQTTENLSIRFKGRRRSPSTEFTSEVMRKKCRDPEERKRRSIRTRQLWQSKEYVEKTIASLIKSLAKRPNELEQKAIKTLDANFPNEWEYTGDGKVMLGKLIPDFTNKNGQKKVIEVFGEYWHTGERTKNREERTERGRVKAYQKLGFSCLVLWDRDIENEDRVVKLVKEFMEV